MVGKRHNDHCEQNQQSKAEPQRTQHPEPRPGDHLAELQADKQQGQSLGKTNADVLYFHVLLLHVSHVLPSVKPVAIGEEANHFGNRLLVVGLVVLAPGFKLLAGLERLSPASARHDQVRLGLESFNKVSRCPALPDMLR